MCTFVVGSVAFYAMWSAPLENRAMKGDLAAMNRLATAYFASDDSILHNVKSVEWMKQAALGGDYRSEKTYLIFMIKLRCYDSLGIRDAGELLMRDRRTTVQDSVWVGDLIKKGCK